MIIIDSYSLGGEDINISITNKFKQVMLYLWILNMVHQDNLDQELGKILLGITHIRVEELVFGPNQHQCTDHFIIQNWNFHTQEVTSFVYHKQFLKDLLIVCIRNLAMLILGLIQLLMDLVPIRYEVI